MPSIASTTAMIRVEPVASFFHTVALYTTWSTSTEYFFSLKDIQAVQWDEQAEQSWITILHELFPGNICRVASRCILLTYSTDATRAYRELLGVDGREVYGRVRDLGPLLVWFYAK